jgi:hypothetical protein
MFINRRLIFKTHVNIMIVVLKILYLYKIKQADNVKQCSNFYMEELLGLYYYVLFECTKR